jgi:hypothetical protein
MQKTSITLITIVVLLPLFFAQVLLARLSEAQVEEINPVFTTQANGTSIRIEFEDKEIQTRPRTKKRDAEFALQKIMTLQKMIPAAAGKDREVNSETLLTYSFSDYRVIDKVYYWQVEKLKKDYLVVITNYGAHRGALYIFDVANNKTPLVFTQDSAQPIAIDWNKDSDLITISFVKETITGGYPKETDATVTFNPAQLKK